VLVYAANAFHGKTLGSLSVSGKDKYKKPFKPLVSKSRAVPYDDLIALESELAQGDVAGFIVEPVQGEAGIIVPSPGYLKEAEQLCRQYKVLLIVDEIQTGIGRTGKLFCCEYENVEPDILCLSKSLGGGVMPVGAMITTDKIWKKAYGSLTTGFLHTSTFGGNSRACVCAMAALQAVNNKELMGNVVEQGEYFLSRLKSLKEKFPIITQVRGKGLMIGLQFARVKGKIPVLEGAVTLWVVRELARKHRILTAFTLNNYDALRIMPPLNVNCQQIDQFLDALNDVLGRCQLLTKLRVLEKIQ